MGLCPHTKLALVPLLLVACEPKYAQVDELLPESELRAEVDFGRVDWGDTATREVFVVNNGELPMGISAIWIGEEEMEENFALDWSSDDVSCPEPEGAATEAEADAKDTGDTGEVDSGGGDGGTTTTEGDARFDGEILILDPGCELPIRMTMTPVTVGKIYGSLRVDTVGQSNADSDNQYYRDPDEFRQETILKGEGLRGAGNIVVTRSLNFGHVWTGYEETEIITIRNVGDGDLTLGEPSLSATCDGAYSMSWNYWDDSDQAGTGEFVLAPDETTFVEMTFVPEDLNSAFCTVYVPSDDSDEDEVDVSVSGNSGENPLCEDPTVAIRSPAVGYVHNSADSVWLELNVFDTNQPADTLTCKVRSRLEAASIATCTPDDASGHLLVELPLETLSKGTDTLTVTVTNACERTAMASTTLLYRASYPDSDDDGDGYGEVGTDTGEDIDCDDANALSYPMAAEVYDEKDNDCDGEIDEGTAGNDDDGDTYSEQDGDCDDADDATYPGAYESPDLKDNDCDGTVDEGTSLYDDDGDGFTETDNDCDDSDPDVNPSAIEICDGIDNNCNGLKDDREGCVSGDTVPIIIGDIQMSLDAIGVGESTTMEVFVYEGDDQQLSYAWTQDAGLTQAGHDGIDNPAASTIQWTAPGTVEGDGKIYTMYVVVTDEDGNTDWAFGDITVFPEPVQLVKQKTVSEAGSGLGCAKGGDDTTAAAGLLLPLLPLFGLMVARRREEDDQA